MRDWILPVAPVIAITYFAINPHQFAELINWAQSFMY
jgi:hypothetical protein